MDQLLAQIFVAALADPDKPGSSACRDLTRHQTQPGGKIAAMTERMARPACK